MSLMLLKTYGDDTLLLLEKNAGNSFDLYTPTGTLKVSNVSIVCDMSNIDFIPADITNTGVRFNSSKSEEMSTREWLLRRRCTPPVPPVTNVDIPARDAICIVLATVVPVTHSLST